MTEETKATAGADTNQQGQENTEPEKITLTKDEYEKQLQSEADKRVQDALKTSKKKWEADYSERVKKERADAEKLAQLSAEEREKELFERSKHELTEKEKTLRNREMKLAAIDILAEEKLPVTFADQLLGESVEDTHGRITKFKKAWHEAIDSEVKERLKGVIPADGGTNKQTPGMNDYIRGAAKRK